MTPFRVRFWGTRGSIPAPSPKHQRYGGNTSCVELRYGEHVLICDAGSGMRALGTALALEFRGESLDADIFVSHTHWDHIQGFPFFMPAYKPGNRFRIHSAHGVGRSFEKIFRGQMDPDYFPVALGDMAAALEFREVSGPFRCGPFQVQSTFSNHPGIDLAYRFSADGKSVTYLTDHETYQTMHEPTDYARKQDQLIEEFCKGSDLLICDAQYTDEDYKLKKGWGHSRYRDSVALGIAARAKRLALFHHDPWHDDDILDAIAADSREIVRKAGSALDCFVSKEGDTVEL